MRLFLETLGCPKNFNDSEGAAGIWEKAGMTVTDTLDEADVIMVNTCGFINDAKRESIDKIFDMIRFAGEKEGEKPLLVVSGCLSQRYAAELAEEMPEVDLFIGVNEYEKLPQLVSEAAGKRQTKVVTGTCPAAFEEFSARKFEKGAYSSTLRIAEGCNNRCAYCVIPQIRGGYRSRPIEAVADEAAKMASAGVSEIILIAQDVTEYGRDIYGRLMLPELLLRLCAIEGIRWIRLMYCYEDKITDELIEVMAEEKKICRYIDIPLQHVSDDVLKGMRRRSTSKSIKNTIRRLREAVPDIHIRTTFITGFPGETEEDFDKLADFVEETCFERLGVFAYSREEGTEAGDREDQIDEEIKTERADCIMRMQVDISRRINEDKVGRIMDVLVEGRDEDGAYIGRTEFDAPEIDGSVIFTSEKNDIRPGDFVKVEIRDAFDYDLTGVEV